MYQSAFTRKEKKKTLTKTQVCTVRRTKKRERGSPLARRGVVCMYVCIRWLVGGGGGVRRKRKGKGRNYRSQLATRGGCVADPKMNPP